MKILVLFLSCLLATSAAKAEPAAKVMPAPPGFTGAMVIREVGAAAGVGIVVNPARAMRPYAPSSTFKILNSLIALDLGVVPAPDAVFYRHDGQPFLVRGERFLPPACEADLSMRVAFRNSCIPAYQQLADAIGTERYRRVLERLDYGAPEAVAAHPRSFWLEGDYKVTAWQQVRLLEQFERGALPFGRQAQRQVREMMIVEETPAYVLRGKTGWVFSVAPPVGWFVGALERRDDGRVFVFALNMDMPRPEDAAARIPWAKRLLRQAGALEDNAAPQP